MNETKGPIARAFDPPKTSFFLFGPRGTGKSTWVRSLFPDALYIDLLREDVRFEYLGRPERFDARVEALPAGSTVIVDEIQRAPELLNSVHRFIETKRGLRFVLTGSSARKLKRDGVNLLGGRALLRRMHPFLASELGKEFRLEYALRFGLLPIVRSSDRPEEQLRSYVALYVREEVETEGRVRRIESFHRFLEAVSFSHGGVLNLSDISRECGVTRRSAEGYIHVLEDLHFSFRLPVFTRRAKRSLTAHPKFYLFDAGVFRTLRPTGPLDRPAEIDGQALEGLVAQHVRAWIDYRNMKNALYFWRTRAGSEVDFVLYGDDGLWAIEAKNTGHVRPEDFRGLRSFLDEYPSARALLLHRGRDRLMPENRILAVPVESFLSRLTPERDPAEAAEWPLPIPPIRSNL
ncbi:MAG: AAA family ATPase [Planctomycetota bacterium]